MSVSEYALIKPYHTLIALFLAGAYLSIGASVLSHYVDEFPLVTAFFLFSIGCLNILVGLIFREKAKDKRNILSWRERQKDILPTRAIGGFTVRDEKSTVCMSPSPSPSQSASSRAGLGFGRQAEKAAEMKGMYPIFRFALTSNSFFIARFSPYQASCVAAEATGLVELPPLSISLLLYFHVLNVVLLSIHGVFIRCTSPQI